MNSSPGESNRKTSPPAEEVQLCLLTELRPWYRVFFENLRDTLLFRRPVRGWTPTPPADFWPDVFVPARIPWGRLTESGVLHVLAVMMLVTFTRLYFTLEQQRRIQLKPPTTELHYEVSEYLPPINTGKVPSPKPRHGEPLIAKQEIVSLPPRPDNFEQTIVSPVDVKLPKNIPLPNIVAWTQVPGPPSADALHKSQLKLPQTNVMAPPDAAQLQHSKLPDVAQNVIAPAEAANLASNRRLDLNPNVIGPPPDDTAKLHTPHDIIAVSPAVMEPPAEANLSRLGAMNVGKMAPTVAAPKLEVPEQRAMALPPGRPGQATGGRSSGGGSTEAAPPPAVQGVGTGRSASGQLIALNLHPADATVPIQVPPGRRSGEFAAGPRGKPNAPGTPDIKGGGTQAGTPDSSAPSGLPPGLMVGQAPGSSPPASVVGSPQNGAPATKSDPVLTASAHAPRVGETPRSAPPDLPTTPARIEEKVFGGKRSYSMRLNMPNLNSAGGSWIIRFAQLGGDDMSGEITAPVATTKVDPAYPAQLMHDGVEGTVVLYAVIHKDGTVGEVRVLRGLEGHLDENARVALLRWKFRPGMKNGEAVDLEAVVQIPYKAPRMEY